ncbi:8406_t:CDS:1, partial [Dentiscutata erythropus]
KSKEKFLFEDMPDPPTLVNTIVRPSCCAICIEEIKCLLD